MGSFLSRRLLQAVFLTWGVCTLLFFLLHLMPGDPSNYFFSPELSVDISEKIRHSLGLDQPLWVQYFKWLKSVFTLDFQNSLISQRPVLALLGEALPRTLVLASAAIFLMFAIGVPVGIYSALRKDSAIDRLISAISLFLYSMPVFCFGLLLIFFFGSYLRIFPISGVVSVNAQALSPIGQFFDRLWHLVLPALTLGLVYAAVAVRFTRAHFIETLGQSFIRTARAKGLSEQVVVFRHALTASLLPVITLFGLSLPAFLGGAVLVEQVFAWHGIGSLMLDAILKRDYPVILGVTFFITLLVILGSLLADLLHRAVDPRIQENQP